MTTSTILAFLAFFFGFSFLIFIHELGHFVVARWAGIKCTQFAIGMGQAICSWRKGIGLRAGGTEREYQQLVNRRLEKDGIPPREIDGELRHDPQDIDRAARELGLGDTEYRLNWMPLGGYVKMLGQEDFDPAARSDDPRSFNSKSVGARMAVISAGVIMNLVFGMALLTVAFMMGVKFPTHVAGEVLPYSPAWSTYAQGHAGDPDYHGVEPGDVLATLDGKLLRDFLDLKLAVALAHSDATLDLEVHRPGRDQPLHFLLEPVKGDDGLLSVGIGPLLSLDGAYLSNPDDPQGKPLEMRLASVDDQPIADFAAYHAAITADPAQPKTVTFIDDKTGRTLTQTIRLEPVLQQTSHANADERQRHLLGLLPALRVAADPKQQEPAGKAGLRKGDLIARIGAVDWPTFPQLLKVVKDGDGGALALSVLREGELVDLEPVTPKNKQIGAMLSPAYDEPIVADVIPGSAAAALNLPAGSRITAIAGKPVQNWTDMQLAVAAADTGDIEVACIANIAGAPHETATLRLSDDDLSQVRLAGWQVMQGPDTYVLDLLQLPLKADNAVAAAGLGLAKTRDFMVQAYLMIARLVQQSVGVENLSGPVGIVYAGTKFTEKGAAYMLFFLGLLSVNLAVINFLPIPIVDGGHAVFLIIEKLKGSPVSANVQAAATYVGLGFIGLVFIVVTFYDIARLVTP